MQFLDVTLIRIVIFVLGVCGFMVAKHIRNHKTKNTPLVCPIGFDCHSVVHSDYSKFLGMPVEFLGMMYYALISLAYLFFIFAPNVLTVHMVSFFAVLSLAAFIFSLYLIAVQIFVLKKGCSWCIGSALISALIFVLTMVK
ncbi:MAG TPA: vitamin K epoxide reductase family protein [Candidatus Paceibacterota bacterium]|jgi:uncharacterized membrane protein|nr:vitamin K epoxide reductase family protein [Candidatus Paceibacterota bacterium]